MSNEQYPLIILTRTADDSTMQNDLSTLIVVDDLCPLQPRSGYIMARIDGVVINDTHYDVATGHMPERYTSELFYPIPIHDFKGDEKGMLALARHAFHNTGDRRHFFHTPETRGKPYMIDITPEGATIFCTYLTTFCHTLAAEGETRFIKKITSLVDELRNSH